MKSSLFNQKSIYFKYLSPKITTKDNNLPHVIWGHGWGQTHSSLLPLATSLQNFAHHWLVDFPGFGATDPPDNKIFSGSVWGTEDYANLMLDWIKNNIPVHVNKIWIGHSFGGRIGINLAANNHNLLQGLCLIASAGIPNPISLNLKLTRTIKVFFFKVLKKLLTIANKQSWLNSIKDRMGSYDYQKATPVMRAILVKVVNENLSEQAKKIDCPTELIYGIQDRETSIEIGKTLQKLIKKSKMITIPDRDHFSILQPDSYQVIYLIKKFIEKIQYERE